MHHRTKQRKGLSPLIATIILIAFAAAMGTLIMTWAIPAEQPTAMNAPCRGVALELQQLPGAESICYSQNTREIRFLVKNSGDIPIHSLRLRAVNRQLELTERDVRAELDVGGAGSFGLEYETANPNNIAVTIIPILEGGRACPSAEIEQIPIPLC